MTVTQMLSTTVPSARRAMCHDFSVMHARDDGADQYQPASGENPGRQRQCGACDDTQDRQDRDPMAKATRDFPRNLRGLIKYYCVSSLNDTRPLEALGALKIQLCRRISLRQDGASSWKIQSLQRRILGRRSRSRPGDRTFDTDSPARFSLTRTVTVQAGADDAGAVLQWDPATGWQSALPAVIRAAICSSFTCRSAARRPPAHYHRTLGQSLDGFIATQSGDASR